MLTLAAFVLSLVLGLAQQDGVSAVRAPVILVPGMHEHIYNLMDSSMTVTRTASFASDFPRQPLQAQAKERRIGRKE